ncbi:uncharacterized protein PAC_16314 [Phialocephala subalpina]|uniref:Uncharacterized protein n=1 Tax=Phialocephala subalpina TaxID=576137 RepID=A0A1L7XN04_9HELO|nr:uncharacterized protein PAC_16314 [Phialocephala subalpina]
MARKNRRGDQYEYWNGPGNGSDYENQSRGSNGVDNGHRGEDANDQENNHSTTAISDDQSNFNLLPYTSALWRATQAFAAAQKEVENVNDLYIAHAKEIEKVPEVHRRLAKLYDECVYKDRRIKQQKNTIAELQLESKDKEADLAKRRAKLEEDAEKLGAEKEEQVKKAQKAEKSMDVRKAELKHNMEKELADLKEEQDKNYNSRLNELEDTKRKQGDEWKNKLNILEADNKKLLGDLKLREKQIEDLEGQLKKTGDRLEDSEAAKTLYKKQKEDLEARYKEIQNEFGLTTQTTDFYKGKFAEISQAIEKISSQYFTDLPFDDFKAIRKELIAVDKCFNSIPISHSDTSQDLRMAHAQRIISSALSSHIWKPFSSEKALSNPEFANLLDEICTVLANSDRGGKKGRAATVWKVLTMQALQYLDQDLPLTPTSTSTSTSHEAERSHSSGRASQAVQDMLNILSPLIIPSEQVQIHEALIDLAKSAVDVWDLAQTDILKITACLSLNPSDRNEWRSAKFDPAPSSGHQDLEMDSKTFTRPRVFTLFPQVVAHKLTLPEAEPTFHVPGSFSTPQQDLAVAETIIHPGNGLPESSPLVVRGRAEEEERKAYLAKLIENADKEFAKGGRLGGYSRSESISGSATGSMSGPLSPSARWSTGSTLRPTEDED